MLLNGQINLGHLQHDDFKVGPDLMVIWGNFNEIKFLKLNLINFRYKYFIKIVEDKAEVNLENMN